jgi:hypothetical protein
MSLSINDEQKVNILMLALDERYASLRVIRERVQSIGIWSLGLLITASGWVIQSDVSFSFTQKVMLLTGLFIAFYALRFRYLEDLERGFKKQQQVAVRLEKALGMYEPNFFDKNEEDPIYPRAWQAAGNKDGNGKFFQSTHLLLYVGFVFLALSIILTCIEDNHPTRHPNFEYIYHTQY